MHFYIKGTVAWDFLSKVISPKVPNWSSDSWSKAVSNIDSNSPRNSTSKVFPRYGPLQRILLYAMGHCGRFGCALWPLRRIWLYAMSYCGRFGYALWATGRMICALCALAQDLVWLSAMGRSEGFGLALWAVAQHLVMRYGRSAKPITIVQHYTTVLKSLSYPLKGQWCQKVYVYK